MALTAQQLQRAFDAYRAGGTAAQSQLVAAITNNGGTATVKHGGFPITLTVHGNGRDVLAQMTLSQYLDAQAHGL